jgi:hypothetical protein
MTVIDLDVRRAARRQVLDTALIRFGETSACCVVRNLSERGALLDIGSQTGIPDQFTLIVPKKKIYSCNVVWRKGRRIGIAFY